MLFSQNQIDSAAINKSTSTYIISYDTLLNVKLNVNSEFDFFEVRGDDFDFEIRPNINLWNKLTVSYKFVSLSIGFVPKFIPGNNDNEIHGETTSFTAGLNLFSEHWLQELRYNYTKGFYLHNTGDINSDWIEGTDPFIQFPDLKVNAFRGFTGYKFNPNFSLNAISNQSEKQVKSAGSFLPILDYDYYIVDNKSDDPSQQSSQRSNNFALSASMGYLYTFVMGSNFYASLGILPGIGFKYAKLTTRMPEENIETKFTDPLYRLAEKAGIGFNSLRFYAGAELSSSQSFNKQNNTAVHNKATRTYFQVFVGYRFNAPRFLKRETEQVKNSAPELLDGKNSIKTKLKLSK